MLLSLLVLLTGCSAQSINKQEQEPTSETQFLMGTVCKITIYDEVKDPAIFEKVFARIAEIENRMTINKDTVESEIIKLNTAAGDSYVQLSPDTFYVMEKAKYYADLSGGKFDVTIGPLVKLWDITPEQTVVPEQAAIDSRLPQISSQYLLLNKETLTAKLAKRGMIVDLGAIAKGYAGDEAGRILTEAGIRHAIINLGGNVLTLNTKPDGSAWRIGVQDPYKPRGDYIGIISLNHQTLVSSGTYERYFIAEGKHYHHLLNPFTGYPEDNSLVSVSIVTRNSIDGDALSTTIYMLGLEEGMAMIEKLPETEAIFITDDKKVYGSSGITSDNFEITNDSYQLQK